MKKILFLTSKVNVKTGRPTDSALGLAVAQQLNGEFEVLAATLDGLLFVLNKEKTQVYDTVSGRPVEDFDLVVFRLIGPHKDEAIALAAFCRKKGIAYIDQYIPHIGNGKASCAFVRWEHDIPVPLTIFGPTDSMIELLPVVGLPAILKADAGSKGKDNYLVCTAEEIRLHASAVGAPSFVLQGYIPNDGDLRVLVMNSRVVLVISRHASGTSHLNNTSQGGFASVIPAEQLDDDLKALCIRVAEIDQLAIAGVDLIQNKETGEYLILEVNRAPQIATGSYTEEKIAAYATALKELVADAGKF